MAKKKSESPVIPKVIPKWDDLYWIMQNTGEHLLRHLSRRVDIPEDAQDIIKAVIALQESRECFFADSGHLTEASALFWIEKLQNYSKPTE